MTDLVAAVESLADALEAAHVRPHRLLVRQHGQVVARRRWAPWTPEVPSLLYSCSKTFTSAAVGLAVAEGAFDYDDTLAELWPEAVTEEAGPLARSITVANALSMATGHTTAQIDGPLTRVPIPHTVETARIFLATEPEARPGVDFAYNNLATWMLSRIVHRHTGKDVDRIITDQVLEPLGVGPHSWQRDADCLPLGYTGLHLDAEDLALFGQLLLDDGVHDGERLLPRQWIEQYRVRHVDSDGDSGPDWGCGYGWQVWMSRHGHRLDGAYGQYALILPEVDAVVVSTNQTGARLAPGQEVASQEVLDAVWRILLPALSGDPEPDPTERVREYPLVGGDFDPVRSVQGIAADGSHLVVSPRQDEQAWAMSWQCPAAPGHPDGGKLDLTVGHDRWTVSHCRVDDSALDVAANGGWREEGLVIDLAIISTPHQARVVLGPDGADLRWDAEPLQPGAPLTYLHPEADR